MKSPTLSRVALTSFIVFVCVLPGLAQAHPGHDSGHGFLPGLTHPMLGLDHILAMLAVGLWAAQLGGRAVWIVPASFVAAMLCGGFIGMTGVQPVLLEQGIATSVMLLGLMVAFAVRLPTVFPAMLVAVFALFHGVAHGGEMPHATGAIPYALGFTLATAILHGVGIAIATLLGRHAPASVLRGVGAGVALGGFALFAMV